MQHLARCLLLLLCLAGFASAQGPAADDEFVGPFPSWLNVKADFGAVGDGKADDTAALQKALDALQPAHTSRPVLYFPAGTYRITGTIHSTRPSHFENLGVRFYGEDAETTIIKWDGPEGGIMWDYGPWFAELARLTLDGAGKAKTALQHGPAFVTYNMIADMIIKDVAFGIEAGQVAGIAETAVMRCRFYRCSTAAISVQNFNSLDWWIWDSRFEDCRIGVTTEFNAGNFSVYRCLFLRSTEADLTMGHTHFYSFRENLSFDSKAFFVAKRPAVWKEDENWSAQVTLDRNRIYNPVDATPIRVGNAGSILLNDNVVLSRPEVQRGPIVQVATPSGDGDLISVGNTFTVPNPLVAKGRLVTIDDRVVSRQSVKVGEPEVLPMRPNRHRQVFEVPAGADTPTIQAAIASAAKLRGQRPVVHFPRAAYDVTETLTVPAGSDVQLVGDGGEGMTPTFTWKGAAGQPTLHLVGPTHATLRNLSVNGNPGLLVDGCDQPGSRIYLEQPWLAAPESGMIVDRLENAEVIMHSGQIGGGMDWSALKIIGSRRAAAGEPVAARVIIHSGVMLNNECTYEVNNGNLLVRDMWYESAGGRAHTICRGYGSFTLHGVLLAFAGPPLRFENYRGKASFVQTEWQDVTVKVVGESKAAKLLFLGVNNWNSKASPWDGSPGDATYGMVNARRRPSLEFQGSVPVPSEGVQDPQFVKEMLAHTRDTRLFNLTPVPPGATDLRLFRVMAGGTVGVVLRP